MHTNFEIFENEERRGCSGAEMPLLGLLAILGLYRQPSRPTHNSVKP